MMNIDVRRCKKFIMPLLKGNITKYSKTFLRIRDKYFLDDIYMQADEKKYLEEIANWYKNTHGHCKTDKGMITNRLYEKAGNKRNSRKVVFVVQSLQPRTYKIISAMYKTNMDITILLCPRIDNKVDVNKILYERLQNLCKKCYECKCFEQVMYEIIRSNASVVHYFTGANDLTYPYLLVRMKGLFGKIVIDRYDIYNGLYIGMQQEVYDKERYLFEHADGISNRSFELPYLRNQVGLHIRGKELFFPDYINEITDEVQGAEKELSIVYAGGVATEKDQMDIPDIPWNCLPELADICKENHCHLHVYPTIWDEEFYMQYIELERRNSFFHFHKPVEWDKLIPELARYDYACLPTRRMEEEREVYGYNTKYKYKYAANNKYFDAISAGIPIIGAIPSESTKMFEEEGICIRWTIEEYDFDELRSRRDELKARVRERRLRWHIDNHIDKLVDFYHSLEETM